MDIVCLGEILIDMFPAEVGCKLAEVSAFRPKPGGAPANVAVAAARLGAASAFIGKVGDDIFGHMLLEVLAREKVDTRGMRFDDYARTTLAIIAKPDENTSEFVFYRNPGADTRLRADELDLDLIRAARAFHGGSLSLTDEPGRSAFLEAIRIARGSSALVSFDVNYRPSLWNNPKQAYDAINAVIPIVNLVKVNDEELELLTGTRDLESGAKTLLKQGPELCVVTLGPKGSFFQTAEGGAFIPAFQVPTVDATGCGDAFIAGLLCQLVGGGVQDGGVLSNAPTWREQLTVPQLRASLRYANAVGALTATTLGVIPALPTTEQVEAFLKTEG
jgi:fructokinase